MREDKTVGFEIKDIGMLPSDKIEQFRWAGSGDICATVDREGSSYSCSFYYLIKDETKIEEEKRPKEEKVKIQGGGKKMNRITVSH